MIVIRSLVHLIPLYSGLYFAFGLCEKESVYVRNKKIYYY